MGLAEKARQAAKAAADMKARHDAKPTVERFAGVTITAGSHIVFNGQGGPIAGATAVIDATGGYTRSVVSMGLHKKDRRELYLTVTGTGFDFTAEVDPDDGLKARQFAARINALGRPRHDRPVPPRQRGNTRWLSRAAVQNI